MPNPRFGNHGGASESGEASTAAATTAATDDLPDPTAGETTSSTGPRPETDATTIGDATSDATSETGSVCALPEGIDVFIEPGSANVNADPACTTVWMSPQGMISIDGSTIGLADCQCPCPFEPKAEHSVTVVGVDIPPLPECGYLVAWTKPVEGGCAWAGLAVFAGSQPAWLVSNALFVPEPVFGGLMISRAEDNACPSDACETAGSKALQFVGVDGDDTITMEEEAKVMMLPFVATLPYRVDNVSAVRDAACVDHLAWTADYVE